MALGDWTPTNSQGDLPNETVADLWQYRRFVHWEFDAQLLGIGFHQGVGSWRIQFLQGGNPVFEQEVRMTLQVVMLGMPGLLFYTWQIVKDEIITYTLDGNPANIVSIMPELAPPIRSVSLAAGTTIRDADDYTLMQDQIDRVISPSWGKTLGGSQFSEFGTMVPGGGGGAASGLVLIDAFWESPVYKTNLPTGLKLNVVFDHWGLGVSTRPEWQFRFQEGIDAFPAILDRQGAIRVLTTRSRGANLRHTYDNIEGWSYRSPLPRVQAHSLYKSPTDTMFALVRDRQENWVVWVDNLGGYEFKPLRYTYMNLPEGSDGSEVDTQVAIWSPNFRNAVIAGTRRGNYISAASYQGKIFFLESTDGIVPSPYREVGIHHGGPLQILAGSTGDGRERYEILEGTEYQFTSQDAGMSWDAVENLE